MEELKDRDLTKTNSKSLDYYIKFSRFLDVGFSIPGTPFRFGADALIGLVPVFGDIIGVILSFYVVFGAARLGVGVGTLFRMIVNITLDFLVGALPVVGDLFDFISKSNLKNAEILSNYKFSDDDSPRSPARITKLVKIFLLAVVALFMALIALTIWGVSMLLKSVMLAS